MKSVTISWSFYGFVLKITIFWNVNNLLNEKKTWFSSWKLWFERTRSPWKRLLFGFGHCCVGVVLSDCVDCTRAGLIRDVITLITFSGRSANRRGDVFETWTVDYLRFCFHWLDQTRTEQVQVGLPNHWDHHSIIFFCKRLHLQWYCRV